MAGGGIPIPGPKSRFGSPVQLKRARIEIIPLIDVMFFLLSAFIIVSTTMESSQTIKMSYAKADSGKKDVKADVFNIGIDKSGHYFHGQEQHPLQQILGALTNEFRFKTNLAVYITGDRDAPYGNVRDVLTAIRSAGFQRVSFAVQPGDNSPNSSLNSGASKR